MIKITSAAAAPGRAAWICFVDSLPMLVLVADDDVDLRDAIAQVLQGHGFRVVVVTDGQHALEYLAQGVVPCAILLDWMMPRMGGEAFLLHRAASEFLSSIPVFVISAVHRPVADHRIQGFLPKPFATDDLLPMLRSVCDEHCPGSRRTVCLNLTQLKNGLRRG